MRFKDQVALITGAGRGIGKAIALAFAREGADIALAEIDVAAARTTAEEIAALGRRAIFRQVDIGDCVEAQRWVADAARELGRVDIMVNNAGAVEAPTLPGSQPRELGAPSASASVGRVLLLAGRGARDGAA